MSTSEYVERIDTTPNGNPVYEVERGDGHLVCIPDTDALYIPVVMCSGETKMSALVDDCVERFDETTIKFPTVLNQTLIDKLDGFEKTHETHDKTGEQVDVWVGRWETE